MNYLLKSKPKYKYLREIVSVVVIFCLLNLANFFFGSGIRQVVHTVASPLWLMSEIVARPFVSIKGYFILNRNLVAKNLLLEDELLRLKFKETDYDVLSSEFDDLKAELGRTTSSTQLISKILSKPPRSPYDNFLIDVGSADGVSLGNRVYVSGNIIVGFIKNITPHTSLVELFSSGDHEQETVLSRTGAPFILKGNGGGNMEVTVPKDADVLWGDVFLYPKFSPAMIGNVYYIDSNSQSSFKKIYIRIPGNVFSAKYVFVEKTQ